MKLLFGRRAPLHFGVAALGITVFIPLLIAFAPIRNSPQPEPKEVGPETAQAEQVEQTGQVEQAARLFARPVLAGGREGIYLIDELGGSRVLWRGGMVKKLVKSDSAWFALTSRGVLTSPNGLNWEERNEGLPIKTIKEFKNGKTSFTTQIQDIKDLAVDPDRPNSLVCATKEAVYLSSDAGLSWKSLGLPVITNGVKAVGLAAIEGGTAFVATSIYGLYAIHTEVAGAKWQPISEGLLNMDTSNNTDEISSILVEKNRWGGSQPDIYISQGFKQALYRLNWAEKNVQMLYQYPDLIGMLDAPVLWEDALFFSRQGEIAKLDLTANGGPFSKPEAQPEMLDWSHQLAKSLGQAVFTAVEVAFGRPFASSEQQGLLAVGPILGELWLSADPELESDTPRRKHQAAAAGFEGIYIPGGHVTLEKEIQRYEEIIDRWNLDSIVVDMKDDFGRLRYQPQDELVKKWGSVVNPVDLSSFLPRFKAKGVWTIARIVVFKDRNLARAQGARFAVWDNTTNAPWQGYRLVKKKEDDTETSEKVYYGEDWVDPYSEEVWDYVARLSQELVEMGFDEIQYDYIRFPTDGLNLRDASYRWHSRGMDKESALISFLSHIRHNVTAPISVDIYGANAWYRTDSRTGQEVETLAQWVDIICPMYYPSHFEQGFLAQSPAEERPWRIYNIGTWRNYYIARGEVLVRPFVQAFYLNVSYDRKYYGPEYINLQVQGLREAGNPGLSYWNNSGQYKDLVYKGSSNN